LFAGLRHARAAALAPFASSSGRCLAKEQVFSVVDFDETIPTLDIGIREVSPTNN
jgi:hypothetical protein